MKTLNSLLTIFLKPTTYFLQPFCYLFFFLSTSTIQAQQVQWASKIIKMPSDLGGKQYGIKRILGKPDVFPQAGSSPNAWAPKNALKAGEVLVVGFDKPQTVKQVAVFENLNSGSVTEILVGDAAGNFTSVWSRQSTWVAPKYRFTISFGSSKGYRRKRGTTQEAPDVSFNPGIQTAILDKPIENVSAVKVKFSFALTSGQKQIDAIGISDLDAPIEAKINTMPAFENLINSEIINTDQFEAFAPMISFDGKKLYFTSFGNINSDNDEVKNKIYSLSKNAAGTWANPLEEKILNTNPNYNYLNANFENFTIRGGKPTFVGTPDSGYEFLDADTNFSKPRDLKILGFNNYNDTSDLTITKDKKTIIMAIESDFSQGGTDIYFSTQKDDGSYGLLQNAGKIINSAADESNPQLLSDQKTLLFASEGFSGFGSFDIYVTQRLDETWKNWSEPINLGSKINTTSFEGATFYDEKNQILYYTTIENSKATIKQVNVPFSILSQK